MKAIIKTNTNEYFTLLGTPHFTTNKEIAQRFTSDIDAMLCTEQYIDSNEGFEVFGMIDTNIVEIN